MTIYFIEMENQNKIKIGYTAKEAKRRMKELQTGQPNKLVLIGTIAGEKDGEAGLHKEFADIRGNGEWFEKTRELCSVISFLIDNQHPWYFCRARRSFDGIWQRAFQIRDGIDLSAYDDCMVLRSKKPKNRDDGKIAMMVGRRIKIHREKYGPDPEWEDKVRKNIVSSVKKLPPSVQAWAA